LIIYREEIEELCPLALPPTVQSYSRTFEDAKKAHGIVENQKNVSHQKMIYITLAVYAIWNVLFRRL
jgi:hypothetical protein